MHYMDTIPLIPLRKAQLEEYAQRRGQDPAVALDEAVAAYLEGERQDSEEAMQGIQEGHADMKAGRTRPAAEFLASCGKNMAYQVETTARAERDADSLLSRLIAQ